MAEWQWEWSECDMDQCWEEIMEIWHSEKFREWLLKTPTLERLWRSDEGKAIGRRQLPLVRFTEGVFGYVHATSEH